MRKSFIKSLLIVVMALLLVFMLVACDKDSNNPTPDPDPTPDPTPSTGITTAQYFNELWALTSDIGSKEVGKTDDIALEFGLEFAINTRNVNTNAIYQQIDLGFDIQAVVGRTKETADNTALKVKLYDPSDKEHTEILSLYLLARDLDNLYIDFGGKNIKLPHNLVSTVWNEVLGEEGSLAAKIPGALDTKLFKEMSANDIINGITETFGKDWNLNSLITSVTKTLGLDLKEMLGTWDGTISLMVGLTTLFDKNGNLDILAVLSSNMLQGMFVAQQTTDSATGVETFKASLPDVLPNGDSGAVGMLVSLVDGMLDGNKYAQFENKDQLKEYLAEKKSIYIAKYDNDKITGYEEYKKTIKPETLDDEDCLKYYYVTNPTSLNLLGNIFGSSNSEIALSFNKKDNAIQDFTISAQLGGLTTEMTVIDGAGQEVNMAVVPELAITISSLKVAKADKDNGVQITPADYKTSIALDEQMSFEVSGITINDLSTIFGGENEGTTSADKEDSFTLNHRVEIGFQGQIDLLNGRTVEKEEENNGAVTSAEEEEAIANQTQLYAYVRLVDLGTNKVTNLIHASFANGKLAIQVEESIASTAIALVKDMFNKDLGLDGVNSFYLDLSDFNIADNFHALVVMIAESFFEEEQTAGTAAGAQVAWVTNTVKAVKAALTYITTDNNLVVATDDVLKSAIQFTDILYGGNKDYDWTVENREEFFVNMLNNPPLNPEDNTIGELLGGIIYKLIEGLTPSDDETNGNVVTQAEEEEPSIMDYALTALYLFAQHVEIAGVELTEDDVKDGLSYYDKAILAVLHGGVEIKADAKNGFHLSVTAKVKDAHITIAEKLEVIDTEDAPLTDLYADYEALVKEQGDTSAWKDLNELWNELFPKQPAPPQGGEGGTDNGGNDAE